MRKLRVCTISCDPREFVPAADNKPLNTDSSLLLRLYRAPETAAQVRSLGNSLEVNYRVGNRSASTDNKYHLLAAAHASVILLEHFCTSSSLVLWVTED